MHNVSKYDEWLNNHEIEPSVNVHLTQQQNTRTHTLCPIPLPFTPYVFVKLSMTEAYIIGKCMTNVFNQS